MAAIICYSVNLVIFMGAPFKGIKMVFSPKIGPEIMRKSGLNSV
jgi:hypothetical protein